VPSAFGWYGAGASGRAGMEGVQQLVNQLAQQRKDEAVAAELDIRRQNLASEERDRASLQQYRLGETQRQDMANRLAAAKEAAAAGNYEPLAALTNQPATSFAKQYQPPNDLEGALVEAVRRGGGQTGPLELGAGQPVRVAGEDQTAEIGPEAARLLDVIKTVKAAQARAAAPLKPEEQFLKDLLDKGARGELTEEEKPLYEAARRHAVGLTKTDTEAKPSTPSAIVWQLVQKMNRGEKLTPTEQRVLDAALPTLAAPGTQAQTGANVRPTEAATGVGQLERQKQKDTEDALNKWRDDLSRTVEKAVDTANGVQMYPDNDSPAGRMRRQAVQSGLLRLEALLSQAPTPEERKKVEALILSYKRRYVAKQGLPGERDIRR